MARTRFTPRRRPANMNFDLRRVAAANENYRRAAAAKEMSRRAAAAKEMSRRRRVNAKDVKIKVLLPQGKNVEVKKRGQIIRRMRVRRKSIFPAAVRNRTYG